MVDKFAGTLATPISLLMGRVSLEETLERFNEQVAQFTPNEIRQRLKHRLGEVNVNLDGHDE